MRVLVLMDSQGESFDFEKCREAIMEKSFGDGAGGKLRLNVFLQSKSSNINNSAMMMSLSDPSRQQRKTSQWWLQIKEKHSFLLAFQAIEQFFYRSIPFYVRVERANSYSTSRTFRDDFSIVMMMWI